MYNTTLEERIKEYERDVKRSKSNLEEAEKALKDLKTRRSISTKELYNGINSYITIKIDDREYEDILGGDGRSRPWSETKKGKVADVYIKKGIYLDDIQRKIVIEYVSSLVEVDTVEVGYEK
jgi:hypothetical protein